MAKGGRREGAGRKSKAEEMGLAALIDSAVSDNDWRAIFKKAASKAMRGDMIAAKFIASYKFGMPKQAVDVTGTITWREKAAQQGIDVDDIERAARKAIEELAARTGSGEDSGDTTRSGEVDSTGGTTA